MRRLRIFVALFVSAALTVVVGSNALAATRITVRNVGGLVAAGPVNTENGFPAWYEDKTGLRLEPCLDGDDPLCGFLPGNIPDETRPISFPDNFPAEFFYQLVSSTLDLPGGGRAVLTVGLEGAFANNNPVPGDQVVFARTRVVVRGAPAGQTMTFKHPFGELTIDTDASGSGKLVEDISPSIGNFTVALKGNFGPFLKWDPAVAPAAPQGYLGDPGQNHAVVGSPLNYNNFSMTGGGLSVATNQFAIHGKISTNHGVRADNAAVNGDLLDVFASSGGSQLEVVGAGSTFSTTPMLTDQGSNRFYARIKLDGIAPDTVTVRNLSDKPVSTSVVDVQKPTGITITKAYYDGAVLTVAADASGPSSYPLDVVGVGTLPSADPVSFPISAPPANVTVKSAAGATSAAVAVSGGGPSPLGQPPVTPGPDTPPVVVGGDPTTGPVATATAAQTTLTRGAGTTLDGSASTYAVSYKWTQVGGTPVTITGDTTAKPTVTAPYFAKTTDTAPAAAVTPTGPSQIQLVVKGSDGTQSAPTSIELTVQNDAVAIAAGARHRLNTELRIDGTSLIGGVAGVRTPPTSVVLYDATPGRAVTKLGTAQVDTLGNWTLRQKPGPTRQVTSVLVQSTRGDTASAPLATR